MPSDDDIMMAVYRTFAVGQGIACYDSGLHSACNRVVFESIHNDIGSSSHCTWKAHGSEWVSLIKRPNGKIAIMFHRDNSVFDAASSCSLSSDCPPGSVLVGQAVLDNGVHGLEPSILIFDIRGHGTASTSEMSAEKRYALLRQEGAKYFRNTRVSIQWVGHGSAAQKFILSGALPHKAECVFSIPHSTEPYVMKVYENEGSDKRSPAIAPP